MPSQNLVQCLWSNYLYTGTSFLVFPNLDYKLSIVMCLCLRFCDHCLLSVHR